MSGGAIDCRLIVDSPAAGDWNMAVDEALLTFWSGLTFEERCDAAETFNIMAQMYYLPEPVMAHRSASAKGLIEP